jgi:hypothetical protein
MKANHIILFICLCFFSPLMAQEKPVKVIWDAPTTDQVELIDGYNVYQAMITPTLLPTKYDVNLTSPLPAGYTVTYKKLNSVLIPKTTQEFIIDKATPGLQIIVRAYSATWDLESTDSDVLTLRPMPAKPKGPKATKVVVQGSINMKEWTERAIVELAYRGPIEQFRVVW